MPVPGTARKVSETRKYNPDTGTSIVTVYTGTSAEMDTVQTYWELMGEGAPIGYGYKTTRQTTAQGIFVTVEIPDTILYTERWNLSTEFINTPLAFSEAVKDYLPTLRNLDITAQGNVETYLYRLALLQRAANMVRSAVDYTDLFVNTPPPTGAVDLGALTEEEVFMIAQIVRDGDQAEWVRPVLRRDRVIPYSLPGDRTRLVGIPTIYTTEKLIDVFNIPDDVADQISAVDTDLPEAFPNTAWSWKLRRDSSDTLLNSGKVQECRDWVFYRWSTITCTLIS